VVRRFRRSGGGPLTWPAKRARHSGAWSTVPTAPRLQQDSSMRLPAATHGLCSSIADQAKPRTKRDGGGHQPSIRDSARQARWRTQQQPRDRLHQHQRCHPWGGSEVALPAGDAVVGLASQATTAPSLNAHPEHRTASGPAHVHPKRTHRHGTRARLEQPAPGTLARRTHQMLRTSG
jgi:hypothetical protein